MTKGVCIAIAAAALVLTLATPGQSQVSGATPGGTTRNDGQVSGGQTGGTTVAPDAATPVSPPDDMDAPMNDAPDSMGDDASGGPSCGSDECGHDVDGHGDQGTDDQDDHGSNDPPHGNDF